jgi:hypothetical protein
MWHTHLRLDESLRRNGFSRGWHSAP